MNYYRCKCGERQSWSSYGPSRCDPCEKCGSTLGSGPDDHPPVEPHDWSPWRWVIGPVDGIRSQERECNRCLLRETRNKQEALVAYERERVDAMTVRLLTPQAEPPRVTVRDIALVGGLVQAECNREESLAWERIERYVLAALSRHGEGKANG